MTLYRNFLYAPRPKPTGLLIATALVQRTTASKPYKFQLTGWFDETEPRTLIAEKRERGLIVASLAPFEAKGWVYTGDNDYLYPFGPWQLRKN